MSKYTTGEIAKMCGVSVRTVQYYNTRNLLIPSELSEGGRRLYSQEDLRRMKIICFLREAGISINSIDELLRDDDPGSVIAVLLEQQEHLLLEEIEVRQNQLNILGEIRQALRSIEHFSVESIGDIAYVMENKKRMRRAHMTLLLWGVPLGVWQVTAIVLWIWKGIFWPFVLYIPAAVLFGILISRYYFSRVAYICPRCHNVFRPDFKEAFWAMHTPTLRKLTCPGCGIKSYCVETYPQDVSGASQSVRTRT